MKIKILAIVLFYIISSNSICQAGMKIGGYQMGHLGINQGGIYSKSAFPISVYSDINYQDEDLNYWEKGTSTSRNYLKFIEVGNGGIHKALMRGNLTKASLVTTRIHKINIPISFLPLYFKETKTTVYGNYKEDL